LLQGFLATLGIILLVPLSWIVVLASLALFQWIGYLVSIAIFTIPPAIVIARRERQTGEFDDKDFRNSAKALEWFVKEVKREQ